MNTARARSVLIAAALTLTALIHLLPVIGVLGAPQLQRLYGLQIDDPSLQLLLRHRAVLFGLIGVFLLWAIWRPALRHAAVLAGMVSVLSFLLLAWLTPGYNADVQRVVWADWIALGCLLLALLMGVLRPVSRD
jgi:hypothetical protein